MKRPRPDFLPMLVAALVLCALHPASAAYWNGHKSLRDLDGDGIPNVVDPDIDNDGIPNALDKNIDGGIAKTGPFAGKYIGDHIDSDNPEEEDADDDGLADDSLAEKDIDGDGKLDDDSLEDDIDGYGRKDDDVAERDIDGDGRAPPDSSRRCWAPERSTSAQACLPNHPLRNCIALAGALD